MRLKAMMAGVAMLAFAHAASAAPVTLAPVSFSSEFQIELDENLGAREAAFLEQAVRDAVGEALAARGATVTQGAPLTIEVSIIDARPNRPTMQQLIDEPSLDASRSISLGGAELRAVLRTADGRLVGEVTHRRYDHDLRDTTGAATTWSSARRAIRQFARKVADAYAANAAGLPS